jgi:hypothetical protein
LLVTVILGGLIVLGSRNLNHFDAALVGYTFATLFAAFGITYRYAMWLRRPPTRMYWRRGWSVFLTPRFVGSNLVEALRRFINAFVANRFIFRRGRLRGAAHWLMMWDRAGAAQQQRAEQAQDADFKKDDACRRRTPGRRHLSRKNHRQQTRSNPKDHHRCPSEGRQVRVRKHVGEHEAGKEVQRLVARDQQTGCRGDPDVRARLRAGIAVRSASGATRNIAPKIENVIHPSVTRCTSPTIHE